MSASQARFLQLTARRTNVESMGQQINQQRLALANSSAGLFEKVLSLPVPTPPSSQDDKYYTQGYNFVDPRDQLQKKIHWQTYDDAVANSAPDASSYYSAPTGLSVVSVVDATVHNFPPAVIAHPTPQQKAELLQALGVDTSKNSSGYRQEIRYVTIDNPVYKPDGEFATHSEQGIALLEFDNLNRLLKVTSLTDKSYINLNNDPNFVAPNASTTGTPSPVTNDGNKVAGTANSTVVYSAWAPSGNYTVDPATSIATQNYIRTASQQVDDGTITTAIPVVQKSLTDIGPVVAANNLYGYNFNQYTYVDSQGVTQTSYAIGDVNAAQARQQLEALSNAGVPVTEDFILMSDADLAGINWGVIDEFSGNFDGNLHAISNLTINSSGDEDYQGMFGVITETGSVSRTKLVDESINIAGSGTFVGGIAGANVGVIQNCSISNLDMNIGANTGSSAVYIGGIAGCSGASNPGVSTSNDNATIDKSSVSGNVELNDSNCYQVGGFSGWLIGGSVTFSSADVDIHNNNTASNYMSVFVSDLNSTASQPIQYCYATGDLDANGARLGGSAPLGNFSHSGLLPSGAVLTGDTDQHNDDPDANNENQSDVAYSAYIRNSSTGANYAVYQGTQVPTMMPDLSSILSDTVVVNGATVNVWNPDGTLNITAVDTENVLTPAYSTNHWTETYAVTSSMPIFPISTPLTVGDGDKLTYVGQFDSKAYNNDMDKYEYQKAEYEFQIQRINTETKNIQLQDKSLELKLKQLDTEHNAIQTEMDAVQKVIQKNIEGSFKTFA